MRKRTIAILAVVAAVASFVAANADVNYTAGSGTVIFAFTCFSTKVCPAHTPVDTAGATLVGAAGSPTSNSLTTQAATLGNGTSANAARVTISSDSTGQVNTLAAAGGAVTMQNGATANGNGTTLTTSGFETALLNVNCSVACSGGTTINFEGTDAVGTYFSIAGVPVTGSGASVTSVTNLATNAQYWVPVAGLTTIRARISAYSAGTITVTGTPVNGIDEQLALSTAAIATGTIGASHSCAASFTVTGCLGQIDDDVKATGSVQVVPSSSSTTAGTTAVAGSGVSNLVGKGSAGNLENAYVVSSAAGWVFFINATSLPANATLTVGTASGNLQGCFELVKSNTDFTGTINYNPGPWENFSTGITIGISSTACPTLTAATTSVYMHAQVN